MIFFFHGTDDYRAQQKISELKAKFRQTVDPGGHNIHYLDPDTFTLENFFTAAKSSGLWTTKKLVVIKNIFDCSLEEKESKAVIKYLESVKDTPEENYLIFWQAGTVKKNTILYKRLAAFKYVQEFKPLEGADLKRWMLDQAKRVGATLSTDAYELLIMLTGGDSWRLAMELEKLAAFGGADTIDRQTVMDIVAGNGEENIWLLVDAIGGRNKRQALELFERHLAAGYEPRYLLAMIARQFRLLLQTKNAGSTNGNAYALASSLKLPSFVAQKLLRQAAGFSLDALSRIYDELLNIDRLLKSDPALSGTAFTLMLNKL